MLEKFLQNFPPPKYIDVPYAGIVFSDNSIRMLVLEKDSKHPVFSSEIKLELGVIEMGKVKNEEALSKILSEKRSELHSPFVRFSIPDETSYIFTAKVPVVLGKDAKESVSFILEENVPLPLSDISFDFIAQGIEESQEGYFANVIVVAASTSVLLPYVSSIRKAGLEPIMCMSESQATAYSVIPKDSKDISVIIHVHKKSAGIYVANGNVVEFSTVVPISLDEPMADGIKSIKSELTRALEYSSNKLKTIKNKTGITKCYLCGEHEILKDLSIEVSQIEGLAPLLANVWSNIFSIDNYVPEIPFDSSLRMAGAVGLFWQN